MTRDPLWYKDAIIYQLHVKAFFDSTDDGVGDFEGLRQRLDYVQDLGVNAIWLLPFYPSPLRDDGYDISDYRNIHPAYGDLRQFRQFVREAHRRGLSVITELVVNHTSDQHPWFQRARRARPGSAWRDFYVWSDTDQRYSCTRIIFTDTETSNWTWDPVANAYYWHRFFSHQPDLNFDSPRVLKEVISVMEFWLDMGVDGLRLDAVPYLCEREGTNNENLFETHQILKRIRAALDARYEGRMLLGEANQWPEDVLPYFGEGDECHMAFHFPLMPRIYMAVALEDRHPITDILRQTPEIPELCQWAVFLRNHDELTLEMVSNRERDYLWNFFAADRRMRLNLGIRRRLAPLLDNDRRKIELLNSLLLSMPGTPILYYGDEIGMGDNIYLGDRDGVRTPMQWSPDRNGGFSRADPARLYLPPIMDPIYGYEAVNVEAQSRSSSSLLSWMKKLIAARRAHIAFGRGTFEILYPGNRKVLAYLREYDGQTILCVANVSRAPQPAELDLSRFKGRVPVELLTRNPFPPIGELPYFVTLPSHGFYWFLLAEEAHAPDWHETFAAPVPELFTLVIPHGWESLLSGRPRRLLETRILSEFLSRQRWFAKDSVAPVASIAAELAVSDGDGRWTLVFADVRQSGSRRQTYLLPLVIIWEDGAEDPMVRLLPFALARVRRGHRIGVLADAVVDDGFACAVVNLVLRNDTLDANAGGRLAFTATHAFEAVGPTDGMAVSRIGREQSNSSLMVGDGLLLKLYRRLSQGSHPEIEMGRYLTDVAKFTHVPPLLGSVEYTDVQGNTTALGVLHKVVRNQGDGWTYTLDYLGRFAETVDLLGGEGDAEQMAFHGGFLEQIRTLGRRTAELHRALSESGRDRAFRPEPVGARDIAAWKRVAARQARRALSVLRRVRRPRRRDQGDPLRDRVLKSQAAILGRIEAFAPTGIDVAKIRHHGDFHLGQVLVDQNDFYIIDFEGEPTRPLAERRRKHCALRDVTGMLRSFDYVAWAAMLERARLRPDATETLKPLMADWKAKTSEAFLEGYRQSIGDSRCYPADEAQARALIEFFALEKALYEVEYEATHRPEWLQIPLEGVLAILDEGVGR